MPPQQSLGRAVHGECVQGQGHMGAQVAPQGGAMAAVANAVGIALAAGEKPCVEVRGHLPPLMHPDVPGKHGIEHEGIFLRGDGGVRVKMEGLTQGMHPGIRAAGAGDGHRRTGGPGEGLLQHLLHRQAVELALPARVGGAVVFHGAEYAPHTTRPSTTINPTNAAMTRLAYRSARVSLSTRSRVRPSPPR